MEIITGIFICLILAIYGFCIDQAQNDAYKWDCKHRDELERHRSDFIGHHEQRIKNIELLKGLVQNEPDSINWQSLNVTITIEERKP